MVIHQDQLHNTEKLNYMDEKVNTERIVCACAWWFTCSSFILKIVHSPSGSTASHGQIDYHVELFAGQEVSETSEITLILTGDVIECPLNGLHLHWNKQTNKQPMSKRKKCQSLTDEQAKAFPAPHYA